MGDAADHLNDMYDGDYIDEIDEISVTPFAVSNAIDKHNAAKKAKTGVQIECPTCSKVFKKRSYQQAFCSNKGRGNCKDRYWNIVDDKRQERAILFH